MCGICGQVFVDDRQPDTAVLQRMNSALVHRGPDSEGNHQASGVGLAMRRLKVIDLSTGDQPMCNEDGTLWIVFNGEIFNFKQLRTDLKKAGHHFKTLSDTECILHLYEDHGDDCVQFLNGQFAFALWDASSQRLLLARDRMGQKPLFYSRQGDTFFFSSELTSLLAGLPNQPAIDLNAIDLYLGLQYIPDPLTAYQGVFKLPPAHQLTWQNGQLEVKQYWQAAFEPKWEQPEDQLAEILRQKLRHAVEIRMLSDVPLGAHLSGGIDSSIIVALMAELNDQPIETFSVGFEESSFSELPFARSVSQRYNTHHHEFILSYDDIPATILKLVDHFGEPFADPSALPLYLLSRATRPHVTVALNGDGGDDIFAGYSRYWLDPLANAYMKLPGIITRDLVPSLMRLFPDRSEKPVGASLVNGLKRLEYLGTIDPNASILRWSSYFSPEQRRNLWRPEFWQEHNAHNAEEWLLERFDQLQQGTGRLDRTLFCDTNTYLPGDLLVKADRMSMAASLEARSPFLDHELVEWASRLPTNMKVRYRSGKYLLKMAFRDYLPKNVLNHRKQGFGIPVGSWFRGPLSGWSRQILLEERSPLHTWFNSIQIENLLKEHQSGRFDHGKRIWSLIMLTLWLEGKEL
jgi:asparagine synthase (glutamine-hydrolysing)